MSPEYTHKLIIIYGGFNTRRYTLVHGFCFLKLLPIGCIGLNLHIIYARGYAQGSKICNESRKANLLVFIGGLILSQTCWLGKEMLNLCYAWLYPHQSQD